MLLGPLVAARPLAIEKERGTFGALCLAVGSPTRVIAPKAIASLLSCRLLFARRLSCSPLSIRWRARRRDRNRSSLSRRSFFECWPLSLPRRPRRRGRHIGAGSHDRHRVLSHIVGDRCRRRIRRFAWLGGASAWSSNASSAFPEGILPGPFALAFTAATAALIAYIGTEFETIDVNSQAIVVSSSARDCSSEKPDRRGYDWTEERRASLPPAVVEGLRDIARRSESMCISTAMTLDADKSSRTFWQTHACAARHRYQHAARQCARRPGRAAGPCLRSHCRSGRRRPARDTVDEPQRDCDADLRGRRTTSTRMGQPDYPGFPVVFAGPRRLWLVAVAYLIVPLGLLVTGLRLAQRRTAT